MEVERGDTGGRTRTVFVDTGMGPATLADPATLAEALARRDAPTPDIGMPARAAGGGYAYAEAIPTSDSISDLDLLAWCQKSG